MAETTQEMSVMIKPQFHWMMIVVQCLICAAFGFVGAIAGALMMVSP